MTRARNRRRPMAEINVVPYIDVMLVLLVIFMITAPMLTQGIQVNLPNTQAKPIHPSKEMPVVVSVRADGRYFLNLAAHPTDPIPARKLQTRVMALLTLDKQLAQKKRSVYVKADAAVSYGEVARVMALLQRAGANSVGLITKGDQSGR